MSTTPEQMLAQTSPNDAEATFSGDMKKWRVAELIVAGATQREAALAVGVNENTVSNWKRRRDSEYMQYLHAHLRDMDEVDHEIQSLTAASDARIVLRRLARNEDDDAETKERIEAARALLVDNAARRRVRVEVTGAGGGALQHNVMATAILKAPDAEKPPKPEGWDEDYGVEVEVDVTPTLVVEDVPDEGDDTDPDS